VIGGRRRRRSSCPCGSVMESTLVLDQSRPGGGRARALSPASQIHSWPARWAQALARAEDSALPHDSGRLRSGRIKGRTTPSCELRSTKIKTRPQPARPYVQRWPDSLRHRICKWHQNRRSQRMSNSRLAAELAHQLSVMKAANRHGHRRHNWALGEPARSLHRPQSHSPQAAPPARRAGRCGLSQAGMPNRTNAPPA